MKRASIEKFENSLYSGSDNAWVYYEEAIDIAKDIQLNSDRERYVYGFISITPNIENTIRENQDALELLKTGATQPHCSVLFDYRLGMFRHNTNLHRLKLVAQVLCARALYNFESGKTKQGIEDAVASLIIAKHIAELSPSILDQISGLNLLYWGLNVLNTAISSGILSKNELAANADFLERLEREWPHLNTTLERQIAALKIYIANSTLSTTANLALLPHHGKEPSAVLKLLLRLRYWRYFFSPRRAFIARFIFLDWIVAEMKKIEKKNAERGRWHAEQTFPGFFRERISQHHKSNHIPEVFTPQFTNAGLLFNLTKIRLLHCSTVVAKYRESKGHYPTNLSSFDTNITTDPYTGDLWEYKTIDDAVLLKSPGFNPEETHDDIIVLLTRKGISHYLSQKRTPGNHE
jgi:hypothetical protein